MSGVLDLAGDVDEAAHRFCCAQQRSRPDSGPGQQSVLLVVEIRGLPLRFGVEIRGIERLVLTWDDGGVSRAVGAVLV